MPKKNMTPEEKKAWGAKMKAAREAKKIENDLEKEAPAPSKAQQPPLEQPATINQEADLSELLARIKELEARDFTQPAQPQVTTRGIVGTVEKYPVDASFYSDPREKLQNEKKLQPFAFKLNYTMDWDVDITSYESKDGLNIREPKFTLQLNRVRLDENGEDTGKRIIVKRIVMHEDPQTALVMAKDNGIAINSLREVDFLNEMRYLRLRDWIMDIFYPTRAADQKRKRQEVIGGKLVEVFEVKSLERQAIPFNEMK